MNPHCVKLISDFCEKNMSLNWATVVAAFGLWYALKDYIRKTELGEVDNR